MFMPEVGSEGTNSSYKNCLENTKLQLTFLGVGATLITLGIVLLCFSQGNIGLSTLGSIATTIGTPLVIYGVIGLIYNRCTNKGSAAESTQKQEKKEKPKPSKSLSEEEKKKQREQQLNAATKRSETKIEKSTTDAKKNTGTGSVAQKPPPFGSNMHGFGDTK